MLANPLALSLSKGFLPLMERWIQGDFRGVLPSGKDRGVDNNDSGFILKQKDRHIAHLAAMTVSFIREEQKCRLREIKRPDKVAAQIALLTAPSHRPLQP